MSKISTQNQQVASKLQIKINEGPNSGMPARAASTSNSVIKLMKPPSSNRSTVQLNKASKTNLQNNSRTFSGITASKSFVEVRSRA
jgi:hypothetical protein